MSHIPDHIPEYDPDQEYLMPADAAAPRKLTDDETTLIGLMSAHGGDLDRKTLKGNRPMLAALKSLLADGFLHRSKWAGHFILFDRHNLPGDDT